MGILDYTLATSNVDTIGNLVHQRFADILTRSLTLESEEQLLRLKYLLAQLSLSASKGSSCLDLAEQDKLLIETVASHLSWLHQDPSDQGSQDTSTVLLKGKRLYLNKYYSAERSIEDNLSVLAKVKHDFDEHALRNKLHPLKYMNESGKEVILNSLKQNLSVITGGPGTGKTTIVVRVLALLIDQLRQQGKTNPKIEVLAPTGKAAARVKESIVKEKSLWLDDLRGFNKDLVLAIPDTSQTVQKFLAINPTTGKSRYVRGKTASVDVLIVDEASMLDVMLVKTLLSAIKPTTRLILLGDPFQLASVEAGNVLAQIVATSHHHKNTWLRDCCVQLTISYRFSAQSGIGQLASATNEGDISSVFNVLRNNQYTDVMLEGIENAHALATSGYQSYARFINKLAHTDTLTNTEINAVFKTFEKWQVFSPYRAGIYGVGGLNQVIESDLALGESETYYFGKPIIVTSNDHALKLYNGDIGICLDKEGKTVCFPSIDEDGNETFRHIKTRILPEHELVYAMTVHKSQGSEYDACLLVVPKPSERQKSLLSREIFYTAITRAKKSFVIASSFSEIDTMVMRKTERMSGLFDK